MIPRSSSGAEGRSAESPGGFPVGQGVVPATEVNLPGSPPGPPRTDALVHRERRHSFGASPFRRRHSHDAGLKGSIMASVSALGGAGTAGGYGVSWQECGTGDGTSKFVATLLSSCGGGAGGRGAAPSRKVVAKPTNSSWREPRERRAQRALVERELSPESPTSWRRAQLVGGWTQTRIASERCSRRSRSRCSRCSGHHVPLALLAQQVPLALLPLFHTSRGALLLPPHAQDLLARQFLAASTSFRRGGEGRLWSKNSNVPLPEQQQFQELCEP